LKIDVAAWYERYGAMVMRRCSSLLHNAEEAKDAAHDVFFVLLKEEKRLKADFPSSLLYTMATNTCLNRLRRRKREGEMPKDDEGRPLETPFIDRGFEHIEAKTLVSLILEDEDERDKAIIYMHLIDGMSLQETGKAVGLSISGVRKRVEAFKHRAMEKIYGKNI
jgi:RNA polymerase sigma-70 factor (ECF subfamily)